MTVCKTLLFRVKKRREESKIVLCWFLHKIAKMCT